MLQQPDWNRLYISWRCRAIWTPRTSEEWKLLAKAEDRQAMVAKLRAEWEWVVHNFEELAVQPKKISELEDVTVTWVELDSPEELEDTTVILEPEEKVEDAEIMPTVAELRKEYKEKTWKNPFNWRDWETLIIKMKENEA